MDNDKLTIALHMALEKNSYKIGETEITILPTELASRLYKLLSNSVPEEQ